MSVRQAFDEHTARAMAAIAFTGCDLLGGAQPRAHARARRAAARGKARARPTGRRREAAGAEFAPDKDTGVELKKKPTEYLRQMYYDTLVFTSEALRHLAAEVGSSQLVVGTDHPIPWQSRSVNHILAAPGFTDAERRAMLGGTAARLLGIEA